MTPNATSRTLIASARPVNEGSQVDRDLRFADGLIRSRCGWSPFEGTTLHSRIGATRASGQLAWDGAQLDGEPNGRRQAFDR